jgi:type IV pilus assembly protein PilE
MGANTQRGLTLVELLVAVAIFAVISAIAIPIYTSYSQRSYDREARADLMTCAMALERLASQSFSYGTDTSGFEEVTSLGLCAPRSDRYTIEVSIPEGGATFELRAVPDNSDCSTITLGSDGVVDPAPEANPCS